MSKLLSLLFVVLFAFDVSLVAARPQAFPFHGRHTTPANLKALNTNTKRFAAGLPPLPPVVKRMPTGVQTAKRAVNSQCMKSGYIQVFDADSGASIGFVSRDLQASQNYGLVATTTDAGTFSSSVFISGSTAQINILDVTDGSHYLAGLITKGEALGDGDSDDHAAILGRSLPTNPGVTPQADEDPSINNRDSETAIWTYDRSDNSLTAQWINYPNQTPVVSPAYISYIANGDKFYLTNDRTAPQNGEPVLFFFISNQDQCGNS